MAKFVALFLAAFVMVTCISAFPVYRIKREDREDSLNMLMSSEPQMLLELDLGVGNITLFMEESNEDPITYKPGQNDDFGYGTINATLPHKRRRRRSTTVHPLTTLDVIGHADQFGNTTTNATTGHRRRRRTTTLHPSTTLNVSGDVGTKNSTDTVNGTESNTTMSSNITSPAYANTTGVDVVYLGDTKNSTDAFNETGSNATVSFNTTSPAYGNITRYADEFGNTTTNATTHHRRRRRTTTLHPSTTLDARGGVGMKNSTETFNETESNTTMSSNITSPAYANNTGVDVLYLGDMKNSTDAFNETGSNVTVSSNTTSPAYGNTTVEAVVYPEHTKNSTGAFNETESNTTVSYNTTSPTYGNFTGNYTSTYASANATVRISLGETEDSTHPENKGQCRASTGKSCWECIKGGPNCHYSHFTKRCFFSRIAHTDNDYECGERWFRAVDSSKSIMTLIGVVVATFLILVITCLCTHKTRDSRQPVPVPTSYENSSSTGSSTQQESPPASVQSPPASVPLPAFAEMPTSADPFAPDASHSIKQD